MNTKVIIAAVAMLAASPAIAADDDRFEGFSIGVDAGWQRNSAAVTAPGDVRTREADSGYAIRGHIGYDWQLANRFVVGVEAGIGNGGASVTDRSGPVQFTVNPGLTFDVSARAGVVLGRNLLLYGRAGYGNSRLSIDASNSAADPTSISGRDREGGLLLGGGAEYALSNSAAVRVEYRRQNLGSLSSNAVMAGASIRF